LFCTKQVWKRTASRPGCSAIFPLLTAQLSKVAEAKSGRWASGWTPSTLSMNQRWAATRFMALAMPKLAQHLLPQLPALPLPALGLVAMHELGEVQPELVALPGRVGALHLAELALEAVVHDGVPLGPREGADVAVVPVVQGLEEAREAVAVLEAHAAAVADLEGPLHLLLEQRLVPVGRLRRVVDRGGPGQIADAVPGRGVRALVVAHLVVLGHGRSSGRSRRDAKDVRVPPRRGGSAS
jgi:hypothetical protein